MKSVVIGADHRGLALKEKIASWIFEWGYTITDMGADSLDKSDDYTVYAERVASVIGKEKDALGILLCGSGVGVDIVANKFDGVRASLGKSKDQVKAGRSDDNMNILVLASDFTTDTEAKEMVKTFLETEFDEKERHIRRIKEVGKIEANN